MQDITKPTVDITQADSYATNAPETQEEEPITNAYRGIHVADHWLKDDEKLRNWKEGDGPVLAEK